MSPTCETENLDLVRVAPSGSGVQNAMKDIDQYFDFEDTTGGRGRFELKGSPEACETLSAVRLAFWAEFEKSKKVRATLLTPTSADDTDIKA